MSTLTATSSNDPFTLVFCGLWDMLENSQEVLDLVAAPNRIKWIGPRVDPRKDHVTDSDRPELRIDPGDPFSQPDLTTGTSGLIINWKILAVSSKQQLDRPGYNALGASIFPVMWAFYRALIGWQQNLLSLAYNGTPFVYRVETGVPIVKLGSQDLPVGPNILGWSCGWNYRTHVMFSTPTILPTPVPPS